MSVFEHRRSSPKMREFYNWFSKFYPGVEKQISPMLKEITERFSDEWRGESALEYACGTGALTQYTAPLFKRYRAKDLSEKMLGKARERMTSLYSHIEFAEGNLHDIIEKENSFDYVFISFAIHLFPPEKEEEILGRLLRVATKKVVIIDHPRKYSFFTGVIEWAEGSYYDRYVSVDFKGIAERLGFSDFRETEEKNYCVMTFTV